MDKFVRTQVAFLRIDNRDYPIYEGVNTIGRNKDAVVNIKNIAVSQSHAILFVIENKHYLSDIGSSNLTYHNGVKLIPFLTCQLTNESKIKFGNVNAVYQILNDSLEIPGNSSRLEMTQDMTQGFYNADTQIFSDTTNFDATQKVDINSVPIHEAATQEVNLEGFKLPGKPAPRKSNDTQSQSFDIHDAATQVFDIALTSKPNSKPLTAETNIFCSKEDDDLTQPLSLNTAERIAEISAHSVNVHEACTQVFDLKAPILAVTNDQPSNVHEECTQVIDLKQHTASETNSESATLSLSLETQTKITEIANNYEAEETQYSEEPNFDIHENYMDDTIEMQNNVSGGNLGYFNTHNIDKLATQNNNVNKQIIDTIEDHSTQNKKNTLENGEIVLTTVAQELSISDTQATNISKSSNLEEENDATDCEDNFETFRKNKNLSQDSNDSMDLLAMDRTLEKRKEESFFNIVELNPLYSQSVKLKGSESESEEIIKPRKRRSIKIHDSQDANSDSDTDSEIIQKTKKCARPLKDSQETESNENSRDSDIVKPEPKTLEEQNNSDIDCSDIKLKKNMPARKLTPTQISQNDKYIKNTGNDSDTDCSDIEVRKNNPAKPLKPTQISEEFAEGSYAIEDADSDEDMSKSFSKRKLSLVDTTIPETQVSFNNSDYIPATQDVFSSKKDSVGSDKTESFKLVLSQGETSEKNHNSQMPCCSKDLDKGVQRDSLLFEPRIQRDSLLFEDNVKNNLLKDEVASAKKLNGGIDNCKNIRINEKRSKSPDDDDLLFDKVSQLVKTKASCKEKPFSQKPTVSESMEPLHLSENTQKIISQKAEKPHTDCNAVDDDFYFAATQKITDSSQSNKINETNDSLYIQATQKLIEDGPIQKHVSEKMDDTGDAFYFQATQQLSENKRENGFKECTQFQKPVSENVDDIGDGIYLQATQQLSEKGENEFSESTKNLSENTKHLSTIVEDISDLSTENTSHKSEVILNSGKKFAFKKRAINLDASLNTCLKPNTPKPPERRIVDIQPKESLKSDKNDLKEMPISKNFNNLRDNFDNETETDIICSMEVPLDSQLKLYSANTERPSNPISSFLGNDASDSNKSSPVVMSKSKTKNISLNHLEDLKGFAKSVEEFKEVLVDKTPCVGKGKEPQNVKDIKKIDLAVFEKIESQNQKLVEKLLKSEEETVKKPNENTDNVDKTNKTTNEKSLKAIKITSKSSQRGLSALNTRSKTSERDKSNDEESSETTTISDRRSVMEDPIRPTRKKSTKSIKTASLCDEVFHPDEESTKDESSDNSKAGKEPSKLATRKMTRRRTSTSSNKSKASEVSDTSDGEEVTNQKASKRLESVKESPITTKRITRRRKLSSSTDSANKEESSDAKLPSQPEKKVTRRGQPRKNILSDEDLNNAALPLLPEVNDSTNKTMNSTFFNATVNQSVNQSVGYTMNQSLALLDARKTTSKKCSSKAPVVEKHEKLLSEDLQLKAPVNRRSMNLVAEKEAVSDIKTHVNLAKISETFDKKTRGRGRTSNKSAVQEVMTVSAGTTKTQGKKDCKPDASLIPPIQVEKNETKAVTRGRKTTATKRSAAQSGSNVSDSGSVSGDSTPKKQKLQRNDSVLLNTAERNLRRQKPKVVFTMLENPKLETMIRNLGGSMVASVDSCTVLVTEHVKRSQKLLTAIGQAKPICSPSWINESKKTKQFLDPWDHILVDKEAETKWQFSLKESLQRSSSRKILQDYTFQIMVTTAVDVLKGAIDACGGKHVTRLPSNNTPNLYIIASAESKSKYQKIVKQNPEVKVIEAEAIFDGVLRQELRFEKHYLI